MGFSVSARIGLGFGFLYHMLTPAYYRFAQQCGATHAVVHLVDYSGSGAGPDDGRWTLGALRALKAELNDHQLQLAAIENFDPAHWHDILLDGPKRRAQMEGLKRIVRDLGAAGIPIMGYNFSLAGVASRTSGPYARGGAISAAMEGVDDTPMPRGMVWNMVWDRQAAPGSVPAITHEELWRRFEAFLQELIPVAEQAGVRLALHPDDPPAPTVRGQPRLVYLPHLYRRALDLVPSSSNALEFCLGSLAEMEESDVYALTEAHAAAGEIAYVHFRNVVGKVPDYREVFVDEGELDMPRIVEILSRTGFNGVLVPDHTPLMEEPGGWHSGVAHCLGYMRGLLQMMERCEVVQSVATEDGGASMMHRG